MQNKDTVMRFYTFSASIMNLGYKKSCRNFWEGYPGSFFSKFIPLQESIIKKVHQTKVTDSYRLDSTIIQNTIIQCCMYILKQKQMNSSNQSYTISVSIVSPPSHTIQCRQFEDFHHTHIQIGQISQGSSYMIQQPKLSKTG